MADDTNTPLFGTPSVSPNALALRRAQALKMMEQGNEYSPILSKWQGLARVAQSLRGNIEAGMEERSESEARKKQLADILGARESGDYSKVIANPFTTPDQLRAMLETNKPEWKETTTGLTPVGPMSARPVAPTLEKSLLGTAESPPVAISPRQFGIGQPGQGAPPPVQPQQPQPGPAASGMQPQAPVIPPVVTQMRKENAETTRDLSAAKIQTDSTANVLANVRQEGLEASRRLDEFKNFKDLASKAKFGVTAELKTWAANHGLQTEGVPVEQLYTDLINFYAPQLRPEGSGRLIGQEMTNFQKSLGGLLRTPAGREAALDFITRKDSWMKQAGETAMKGNDLDTLGKIYRMERPNIDMSKLSRPQPSREEAVQELRRRGIGGF